MTVVDGVLRPLLIRARQMVSLVRLNYVPRSLSKNQSSETVPTIEGVQRPP